MKLNLTFNKLTGVTTKNGNISNNLQISSYLV